MANHSDNNDAVFNYNMPCNCIKPFKSAEEIRQALRTMKYDWGENIDLYGRLSARIRERIGDMEFSVDENGKPDGVKNHQEMVITIADEVADKISEEMYEKAMKKLVDDGMLDEEALRALKESNED